MNYMYTHTTQLVNSVDVDLQLFHSDVFIVIVRAPPHFNVVTGCFK